MFVMLDSQRVAHSARRCSSYPSSSTSDAQWALLEPLLPAPGNTGDRAGVAKQASRGLVPGIGPAQGGRIWGWSRKIGMRAAPYLPVLLAKILHCHGVVFRQVLVRLNDTLPICVYKLGGGQRYADFVSAPSAQRHNPAHIVVNHGVHDIDHEVSPPNNINPASTISVGREKEVFQTQTRDTRVGEARNQHVGVHDGMAQPNQRYMGNTGRGEVVELFHAMGV